MTALLDAVRAVATVVQCACVASVSRELHMASEAGGVGARAEKTTSCELPLSLRLIVLLLVKRLLPPALPISSAASTNGIPHSSAKPRT